MKEELYDVVAVNMRNHKVRIIGDKKTLINADAIQMIAVGRLLEEFTVAVKHGIFKDGDEWGSEKF